MATAVTKLGPYFAGGGGISPNNQSNMKFSQMRGVFRLSMPSADGTPGTAIGGTQIKASELLRVTDVTNTNPNVPDCTENNDIGTAASGNWKVSQMQFSIKYYYITQTGTQLNLDIDALSWNSNFHKTILKWMNIDGTLGSNSNNLSAADINATATNLTVDVTGTVWGAKGDGGTLSSVSGEDGGNALTIISPNANNLRVNVQPTARIYGGGGGGEKALNGSQGSSGTCSTWIYKTVGSGCNYCGDCGAGWERYGGCATGGLCNCYSSWGWTWCNGRHRSSAECRQHSYTTIPGGIGGEGGDGGPGRGYDNQSGSLAGDSGVAGSAWSGCPNPPYTGGTGTPGTGGNTGDTGGDGGEWGLVGQNTPNTGSGGAAGKAISGSNYSVIGTINNNTIRGAYNP